MENLTEEQKVQLRCVTEMELTNFYIDPLTKVDMLRKLRQLGLQDEKGAFSATIRILLSYFADNKFDGIIDDIHTAIRREILLTKSKSKRSTL